MKILGSVFNYISWGSWIIFVTLNVLGVTNIPWNVVIAPVIVFGIGSVLLMLSLLFNKDYMIKLIKEKEKLGKN